MMVSIGVREKVDGVSEIAFRRQHASGKYGLNCPLVRDIGAVCSCDDVPDESALQKLGVIGSGRHGALIVAACGVLNRSVKLVLVGLRVCGGAKGAGGNQEKSFHWKSLCVGKFLADHIRAALGVSSGRGAFNHPGWSAVVSTGHHTQGGVVARVMCPPSSLLGPGAWFRLCARPFLIGVAHV